MIERRQLARRCGKARLVLGVWLHQLDQLGMDDPDNNESQPEDICAVCDRRIVDHPGRQRFGIGDNSARWPHRRAAFLIRLALGQL